MGVTRLQFAGLLVAIGFGLVACGGGSNSTATATPAASPSASTQTPVAQTPSTAGETPTISASTSPVPDPIAQPVRRGNFELTLNGVTDPYLPDDEAYAASDGYRWLLVDVSLKNTSQEELDYGADFFAVYDTNGDDYYALSAAQAQEFDVGTVAPGETIRGQIAFEVDEGVTPARLVFDPDLDPATEIDIALR